MEIKRDLALPVWSLCIIALIMAAMMTITPVGAEEAQPELIVEYIDRPELVKEYIDHPVDIDRPILIRHPWIDQPVVMRHPWLDLPIRMQYPWLNLPKHYVSKPIHSLAS